ncbi:MAG: fibronectin type III domain-containing protein [Planctomycetota bacterium]|nr:fibronectin type III domain-containing protein [Planctomycetota bacterium]
MSIPKSLYIPVGAVLFSAGTLLAMVALTFNIDPETLAISSESLAWSHFLVAIILIVSGVGIGSHGLYKLDAYTVAAHHNRVAYSRYLVGTGYALLLFAMINLVALAGFAYSGVLDQVFPRGKDNAGTPTLPAETPTSPAETPKPAAESPAPPTETPMPAAESPVPPTETPKPAAENPTPAATSPNPTAAPPTAGVPIKPAPKLSTKQSRKLPTELVLKSRATALVLLVTVSMAILGALFFVANSLQEKQAADEDFDAHLFWAGLWYRLGESVLFAVVCFVAIRRLWPQSDGDFWLPLLALVLGMSIRTGERLMFALTKRTLKAVTALLPLEEDVAVADVPGAAQELKVTSAGGKELEWKPPASGSAVARYRIEYREVGKPDWTRHNALMKEPKASLALEAGMTYEIRVIAENNDGEGPPIGIQTTVA